MCLFQFWFPLGVCPAVGLLGHMAVLFPVFLRNLHTVLHSGRTSLHSLLSAKSLQLCPTLCDPIDGSPPGSAVPGILQARTLEWVAISFSIVWKWKVKVKSLSHVRLVATPWTAAYQAPPSMRFSRQEYWSGLPLPSPIKENKKFISSMHAKSLRLCPTLCNAMDYSPSGSSSMEFSR